MLKCLRLSRAYFIAPLWLVYRFKNNFLQLDWIEDFVKGLTGSQGGFSVR